MVEELITAKANLNEYVLDVDGDELTALHVAILNEYYDSVQRLLHTGQIEVNKPTRLKGKTAVFIAAEHGRIHMLKLLVEHVVILVRVLSQ